MILRAEGHPIGRATSGRLGRFVIDARAPQVGVHRLTLTTASAHLQVGRLPVRDVSLAAVGDVTPGEQVGPAIEANGAGYPWAYVGGVLGAADIATANLEGAVSGRGAPAADKRYHFEGPVGLLVGARDDAGIDVVTLANNHVMDYGSVGLADTLAAARRAKIATVGAGGSLVAARRPAYIEVGGITVAFLGYSEVNPLGFKATDSTPGTSPADVAAITSDVRAARRHADVVVCWFHWGIEGHAQPDGRQRMFAQAALAAGAKLVLGAHPHVLGAVARPTRTSLVAWTLGNFVFPSGAPTAILLVRLDARGATGFRLLPAVAGAQPHLR